MFYFSPAGSSSASSTMKTTQTRAESFVHRFMGKNNPACAVDVTPPRRRAGGSTELTTRRSLTRSSGEELKRGSFHKET